MSEDRRCPVCGRPLVDGKSTRVYCDSTCRSRKFRRLQDGMGRKRTRIGYADGLSAYEARDRYGDSA